MENEKLRKFLNVITSWRVDGVASLKKEVESEDFNEANNLKIRIEVLSSVLNLADMIFDPQAIPVDKKESD